MAHQYSPNFANDSDNEKIDYSKPYFNFSHPMILDIHFKDYFWLNMILII